MNRKKTREIIAILVLISFLIPPVQAPSIEVSPIDTEDDAFITGIGAYFGDTPWLFLKDANQELTIGNRFRNVTIPQGTKINNATLFVRTIYLYQPVFGADFSELVTIYGDDADDSLSFSDSGSFTRPYTDALVVWNISDVTGNQWNEVSVTGIVQEIVDRIGWVSGNDLSLIIESVKGTPRREFASVDNNPSYTAYIDIFYNEEPSDPQDAANPPFNDTDKYVWEYNDTYRGIDVWEVWDTNTSGNRGANAVNWRKLNLTQLTEIDSGNAIAVNNASWASLSAFVAQQINSLYNDTGSLGIDDFFIAMAVNLSAVTGIPAGNERVATVAAISTSSPVGGAGLLYGPAGNFSGLAITLDKLNEQFTFRLVDRAGVGTFYGTPSQKFEEDDNEILYIFYSAHLDWHVFNVYKNPDFTGQLYRDSRIYANGLLGPFRYAQAISSLSLATTVINVGEYYTFPNLIDADPLIQLIYSNGTFVTPDPITPPPDFTPDDIKDIIDDLLGGAQPEDPETDKYGAIGKFRWKLLVMAVGFIMLLGSPIAGIHFGASPASWIKLLFVMAFGLAILSSLKFM